MLGGEANKRTTLRKEEGTGYRTQQKRGEKKKRRIRKGSRLKNPHEKKASYLRIRTRAVMRGGKKKKGWEKKRGRNDSPKKKSSEKLSAKGEGKPLSMRTHPGILGGTIEGG